MRRQGPSPKRSRAALLWGLAGFVLLQLGLAAAIEGWLPEIRDPEYGHRLRRLAGRTTATPRPRTVIMLGSSRTTRGFHARRLESALAQRGDGPVVAFNFGTTGAGPLRQLLHLRRLLARGIHPDLLLVEILPPFFAVPDPGGAGRSLITPELEQIPVTQLEHGELAVLERYGGARDPMRVAWWRAWPVPWYTHREALLGRILPALLPYPVRRDWLYQIDACGWVAAPALRPRPEQLTAAVRRALGEYAPYFRGDWLSEKSCQALQELLDLCRDSGVAVVLVLMPEATEFRRAYPQEKWARMESYLKEVGRASRVPVVNAREWVADEDFSDAHHLLQHGAEVFTDRLNREAIRPFLEPRSSPSS
jgi:hypothetical protein